MRLGIFGGSFNPVHAGHLKLAATAFSELNLNEVIFVPSNHTPLKNSKEILPASQRLGFLKKALSHFPYFRVSDCEIRRKGVSYTVDTLKAFRRKFGTEARLFFLCGADTLKNLSRWKSLKEVLKLCRFVVMSRPGTKVKDLPEGVFYLPFDALSISATEIRRKRSKLWNW